MVGESESRVRAGAESKAVLGGWFGPQVLEETHRDLIALPETTFMDLASGSDSEIICEASRFYPQRFHDGDPRLKGESSEHHAEGASLGDAAGLEMRGTQSLSYRVVIEDVFMEGFVCGQDGPRKASRSKKII